MSPEKATKIVSAVIAGRKRWGYNYGTGEFSVADITEALVVMNEAGEIAADTAHDDLVREKRRLTAAVAREARAKKANIKLKDDLKKAEAFGKKMDTQRGDIQIKLLQEQATVQALEKKVLSLRKKLAEFE